MKINSPFADADILKVLRTSQSEPFSEAEDYEDFEWQHGSVDCEAELDEKNSWDEEARPGLLEKETMLGKLRSGFGRDPNQDRYQPLHSKGEMEAVYEGQSKFELEDLEEQFLGNLKNLFNGWSQVPKNIVANTGLSGSIIDLRHLAKNVDKGTYNGRPYRIISSNKFRNLAKVNGIVLHQMAFNRDDDFGSYLKTGAHYIILRDGKIGQLYDHNLNLNASNGFNRTTLAVEFAGNFPNLEGKWWHSEERRRNPEKRKRQEHRPTKQQIQAGRFLLRKLISDPSLPNFKHVYAHRQSSKSRINDPGPDIWCGVAEWAISNLGFIDASQVKVGSGSTIPGEWKKCQYNDVRESSGGGVIDLANAVEKNNQWKDKIGWGKQLNRINPLLGLNILHSIDADFVKAVAAWQRKSGFTGKDMDGIIGPNTWKEMKARLVVSSQSQKRPHRDYAPPTTNLSGPSKEELSAIPARLGKLVLDTAIPELSKSIPSYQFTKEDALWMARFVTGEAGVKNDDNGHAVLWAMFNRFGILRHRVSAWSSFQEFLRLYSTTLQPMLRSKGAAERVWANYEKDPARFPIVPGKGKYKGTNIQIVQYKKHIDLQKMKWQEINPNIRSMVINTLRGEIPNPGIGIATEFASTRVYFRQNARKQGKQRLEPTLKEWERFTINYANKKCKQKMKGCTWIGYRTNLDQMKNAFFIDNRFINVPPAAIKIVFDR